MFVWSWEMLWISLKILRYDNDVFPTAGKCQDNSAIGGDEKVSTTTDQYINAFTEGDDDDDTVSATVGRCQYIAAFTEGPRMIYSSNHGMWCSFRLTYLCMNASRSAARPEPSQTTTGTGGVSVTYSNTALMVLVPPSITKHTTGVLQCVPGHNIHEVEWWSRASSLIIVLTNILLRC